MWDRLTEVFAVYGATMLVLLVAISHHYQDKGTHERRNDAFFGLSVGWTIMTFVLGSLYVLTEFISR